VVGCVAVGVLVLFWGCFVCVGVFGFGFVVSFLPFGLPGKRF